MNPDEIKKEEEKRLKEFSPENELVPAYTSEAELSAVLGDYDLIEVIGQGGMGKVFRAKRRDTGAEFAIKILHAELTKDKVALKRFEQEVEAASKINHANLVTVYGHGETPDSSPYLVMDLVRGKSLAQLLEEKHSFNQSETINLGIQLCKALGEAHSNGIIHRDLKPANILIEEERSGVPIVKVVDFGIARVANESVDYTQTFTQTADVVGSPKYMSPEQCTGKSVDERSDIYSLGCIIYELLAGKPPFDGGNAIQIILKHINEIAEPIKAPGVSGASGLNTVIENCLNKNPADRYSSVEKLLEDLALVNQGKQVHPLKKTRVYQTQKKSLVIMIAGVLVAISLGFGLAFYQNNSSSRSKPDPVPMASWRNLSDTSVAAEMQKKAFEHFTSGSYSQAIPALKYVAETEKKAGDKFREAFAYQCIGQCYLSMHQYPDAEIWYQKSLKHLALLPPEKTEGAITEATSGYIEVLSKLGRDKEARSYLDGLNTRSLKWLERFYSRSKLFVDANRVREQIKAKGN